MSPRTARQLRIGDYVARRGPQDTRKWTHVGIVARRNKIAISIDFAPGHKHPTRYKFDDPNDLSNIRTATVDEIAGYLRTMS